MSILMRGILKSFILNEFIRLNVRKGKKTRRRLKI